MCVCSLDINKASERGRLKKLLGDRVERGHSHRFTHVLLFLLCRVEPPQVNFTNILQAAFALILFHQKITKPNCKWRKALQKTLYEKAARKMLVKLTPVCSF